MSWLWAGRLPLAAVSLLVGDGGLGKSTLLAEIAARVSRGQALPGGPSPSAPAAALLLSAEDHPGAVVRPRVRLAGGDLGRVYVLDEERVDGLILPRDVELLEREIVRTGARFVGIDPLSAFLGAAIDSYRDTDVRRVLRPLRGAAERTGAAIVGVLHLNRRQGAEPLARINGSGGFGNAARAVLAFARHPGAEDEADPRRVVAVAKSNYGAVPASMELTVAARDGEGHPSIGWGGEVEGLGARELLGPPATDEERSERDEAEGFLRDALAGGARPVREVEAEAREAGVSRRTLERARRSLGVVSERRGEPGRRGGGGWWLVLPAAAVKGATPRGGLDSGGVGGLNENPHGNGHPGEGESLRLPLSDTGGLNDRPGSTPVTPSGGAS